VDALHGQPGSTVAGAKGGVGAALAIASRLPAAAGRAFAEISRQSFVEGFHTAVIVGAATTIAGLIAVLAFLPSRPSRADVERQAEEFAAERERELAGTASQARQSPVTAEIYPSCEASSKERRQNAPGRVTTHQRLTRRRTVRRLLNGRNQ
jgi:hypothetical protein